MDEEEIMAAFNADIAEYEAEFFEKLRLLICREARKFPVYNKLPGLVFHLPESDVYQAERDAKILQRELELNEQLRALGWV